MKKIDIGQVFQILANVGVLIGIAFLAVELHQNNENIAAQTRASRAASSQATFAPLLQNPLVAEALAEDQGAAVEDLVRTYYFQHTLIGWEYSWGEVQQGILEESDLPVEGWVVAINSYPSFFSHWSRMREGDVYDPEFVAFIDKHMDEYVSRE